MKIYVKTGSVRTETEYSMLEMRVSRAEDGRVFLTMPGPVIGAEIELSAAEAEDLRQALNQ